MKTRELMLQALCAAAFTAAVSAGCTRLEPYTIDAPDDLAEKIADYQAEKDAGNVVPDDAVPIEIAPDVVGLEDNTSSWWADFSQYFTVPVAKKLILKFNNFSLGEANYQNWVLGVTNAKERGAEGYSEYFVLRADSWKWGSGDNGSNNGISLDMDGVAPDGDAWWEAFRDKMNGAEVELTVDHASEGTAYVTAVATATDGTIITETYSQSVSFVDDINVFLVADHAHFVLQSAFLASSDYPIIPDSNPASVVISGNPTAVNYSENPEDVDYWGDAVVTVVFEDGSSMAVDKEKVSITAPDLTTPGNKTVVVTYNYTKKGVLTEAAAGYYNFELVADLESLLIVQEPSHNTYYFYDNASLDFRPYGLQLQAVYQGGTTVDLTLDDVTVSPINPVEGEQEVTFTYKPGSKAVTASTRINLVKGGLALGVPELNSAWWTYFAPDRKVPQGESASFEMDVYSVAADNWQAPVAILRKGDLTIGADGEYAVVRIDNFGWGSAFANADADKESDWNWDLFKPMLTNAHVTITATNNGDNAVIRYDVLWANGEEHYQLYKNIAINDPDDVYLSMTVDNCYAVLVPGDYSTPDPDPQDPTKVVSISAGATAKVVGGTKVVTLSPENVVVKATRANGEEISLPSGYSVSFTGDKLVYDAKPGTYADAFTVTYTPAGGEPLTTKGSLTIAASDQEKQAARVGADDFSNAWWTTFSKDWTVAAGESLSVGMEVHSLAQLNHQGPCTILRKADGNEYGVVRMDNYGWLYGTNTIDGLSELGWNLAGNWNWEGFAANIEGSHVTVTVANSGNGKASIRYYVVYANGETHFQYYDNISVNSDDVQFAFVTEASYLDFD
ncbi:MAG: hypothetical protein II874_06345 [Bacteroidales bacterium]|nr:hypothetical protein [Bacteroidales bacterium]